MVIGFQCFVQIGGVVVLLDDGIVDGFVGFVVLDQYGFVLVGDVDGGDGFGFGFGFFDYCVGGGGYCGLQVGWVMFDLVRVWKMLWKFFLCLCYDLKVVVKDDGVG